MNKPVRPNIFEHSDHLAFLREWMEYLKRTRDGFSLRTLAKDAGVSVGYLPMVLSGQRALSDKALEKIVPRLGLRKAEGEALKLLKRVGESESPADRLEALQQLQKIEGYRESNAREIEVYQYLTRWTYVAIREMAMLDGFVADVEWIRPRLRGDVSAAEIRQALDFLFANGYLGKDEDGRVVATAKSLQCKDGVYKLSLSQYHREMIRLAGESIDTTPRNQRYILGHTGAIHAKNLDEVRRILNEALEKIERLTAGTDEGEAVYHVELAAFPLTVAPNKPLASALDQAPDDAPESVEENVGEADAPQIGTSSSSREPRSAPPGKRRRRRTS